MHRLIAGSWAHAIFLNIAFFIVIFAVFEYKRKLVWIAVLFYFLLGAIAFFLKIGWQPVALGYLGISVIPLIFLKVREAFDSYRGSLEMESICAEKIYKDLVAKEGVIYDAQLKYNEKLSKISSLYELTKDMSTSLHYDDIFKVLATHLQKMFLYKRVLLMLIDVDSEILTKDAVFESQGLQDNSFKAKGIFPKLEIKERAPSEHDKKIRGLLKSEIKMLQIVDTQWDQNPYKEYLPDGAKTYMAVPVIIENKLIGILAIEDLPTSDFGKFTILAAQFALEMKRIILYEKVEELAITDGLTKAFAKRHMMERLVEEFERSARHGFNLSFIMIDIDYFKNYNDTYGHLVGDVVLKHIVTLVKNNTREVDLVGRFGGEEFCVILPETNKEEAQVVSERIREVVEKYGFKAYDEMTSVTVSIGVATFPDDCNSSEDLIDNSDKALYQAKAAGRNKVCMYD